MGGGGEQRADVSAEQPQFAVAHDDVGVLELDTTGADGFDLPAFEDETGFVFLFDEIVVVGFFVADDAHGVPVVFSGVFRYNAAYYLCYRTKVCLMPRVHKTVVLPYSQAQMYDLVERVEDYPKFLPWCGGVTMHNRTETSMDVTIKIAFRGLHQSFRTVNRNTPPSAMEMRFRDGPFKHLVGKWRFEPVALASAHKDGQGVRVVFDLDYEFSNKLFALAIGPVFNVIAQTFMDGFVKQAKALYG